MKKFIPLICGASAFAWCFLIYYAGGVTFERGKELAGFLIAATVVSIVAVAFGFLIKEELE